ncbi:hypothetical protein REPUB_Repub04eG0208500 [Reevesia pubescens]
MFKVDVNDGIAKVVLLNGDLDMPDGIAMRRDDVVLVVSTQKLWFLKSDDSWGKGTMGKVGGRERFEIVEVKSEKESGEEHVWIFVLVGLGLAYFLFWRF